MLVTYVADMAIKTIVRLEFEKYLFIVVGFSLLQILPLRSYISFVQKKMMIANFSSSSDGNFLNLKKILY